MDYVKVAKVTDFDEVAMRSYRILARHVGVFKEEDGSFYAIETGCKHANANLLGGKRDGDVVTCPMHGWKYNLKTGACVWGTGASLRRYALKIEDGCIYISCFPIEE